MTQQGGQRMPSIEFMAEISTLKNIVTELKARAEKLDADLERMSGLYVRYFEMYQEHSERAEKAEAELSELKKDARLLVVEYMNVMDGEFVPVDVKETCNRIIAATEEK
jgi:seryl-tRNA synthetase